jgi:hypothetical protein
MTRPPRRRRRALWTRLRSRTLTCLASSHRYGVGRPPTAGRGISRCPVQRSADRRHAVLRHPADPEPLHQPVDFPGRDAVHVGLYDDRHDRLLALLRRAALESLGSTLAPSDLRGINSSSSWALVAHGRGRYPLRCVNRAAGATSPSSDLSGHLGCHKLLRDERYRLTDEILKPPITRLRDDVGKRDAPLFGGRGVSFSSGSWLRRRARGPRWSEPLGARTPPLPT